MESPFTDILHLFRQLNEYRIDGGVFSGPETLHHSISELGIVAHGGALEHGTIEMGSTVSAASLQAGSTLSGRLRVIGTEFLGSNARVIFFSCAAASGAAGQGSDLLRALSTLWPGRTVVGFSTYGFVSPSGLTMAGNVTDALVGAPPSTMPAGFPRHDPAGPSATHARNGAITQWPDPSALWAQYQRAVPGQASRVESQARAVGTTPLSYYITRIIELDTANPGYPGAPAAVPVTPSTSP
jgi:hypothetical protein